MASARHRRDHRAPAPAGSGLTVGRHGVELLVVAGERSGDGMAASVLERLACAGFGLGGAALRGAGLFPCVDLEPLTCMGLGPTLRRAPAFLKAASTLLGWASERRPRAALLVGFSEFNGWLAPRLRQRGCSVVWYSPPQAWAWRPGRAPRLAQGADTLAVLFPFEEAWWRERGADARYVGHPSFASLHPARAPDARAICLLPGSRPDEVRQHLPDLLAGWRRFVARFGGAQAGADEALAATVVVADSLDLECQGWARRLALEHGCKVSSNAELSQVLERSWVALVASGTATLDCVAAGVPPIIVYRVSPLSWQIAQRLARIEHVGLPNILLDGPCFIELLQSSLTPDNVACALLDVRRRPQHYAALVTRVHELFGAQPPDPAGRVAELLDARLARA
jgi:lipid-A-disaccharide synthase